MNKLSMDDVLVFLHVAREGSVNAAAQCLGASTATLSRRIGELERQTGRTLFDRHPGGYTLTAEGQVFREQARSLEYLADDLGNWLQNDTQRPAVRISAGSFTSLFLATHFTAISQHDDTFDLVFVPTEALLNIAFREVDIGLRSRQPETPSLVSRRLAEVNYACYRRAGDARDGWVMLASAPATKRPVHWMRSRAQESPGTHVLASTPRALLDLVLAGAGRTVLPCFIGDAHAGLTRDSDIIDELAEHQWLVMQSETRHRPEVRTMIERIATLVEANRDLYRGLAPPDPDPMNTNLLAT